MNKNPLFSAAPVPGARFRNLHAASLGRLLAAIASLLIVSLSLCHAAQSCTLAWNASSDPSVAGYELRYGTSSGNPSQSIDVLKTTTFTVSNLNDATTYYFVVAAYNAAKVESQPSNEVSYTTPSPSSTPTAGPTISIGETSILASPDSGNGNLLVAQQATLTQTATIESLSFYVTNASGKLRLGIFDATGPNGGPGTKKAETAEITPTVGWNKANVIAPVSLPQGTYWLAYHASDNNLAFVKNLSGTARYYADSYGPMPATFSTSPQSEVVHWSLFATLNSSGTGGSGSITREVWTGISGPTVANIPVGAAPNFTDTRPSFEAPTNWADNYGTRMRGHITAPVTGNYTFWIASDDNSELWLSINDSPANKVRIGWVSDWTDPRQWNKFSSQKSSAPINLTAGQRYYVEALQKEGGGGDNLAVGWAKPGESTSAPSEVIPGSVLSPFSGTQSP